MADWRCSISHLKCIVFLVYEHMTTGLAMPFAILLVGTSIRNNSSKDQLVINLFLEKASTKDDITLYRVAAA
jgi:hypothetical protein